MKISIIVAVGLHDQIGLKGKLPWYSKEDLQYFKKKTMNHVVIMGRKTFEFLPKILDGRKIIVLSKTLEKAQDVQIAPSLSEALSLSKKGGEKEVFIAGGGGIYQQFIDLADRIYLSRINYDGEADTYFPNININEWKTIDEKRFKDGSFIIYERFMKIDTGIFT